MFTKYHKRKIVRRVLSAPPFTHAWNEEMHQNRYLHYVVSRNTTHVAMRLLQTASEIMEHAITTMPAGDADIVVLQQMVQYW